MYFILTQHALIGAKIDGKFIVRPYTPIAPIGKNHPADVIELLVKVSEEEKKYAFKKNSLFRRFFFFFIYNYFNASK